MPSVKNIKTISGDVWVPTDSSVQAVIIITDDDGNEHYILDTSDSNNTEGEVVSTFYDSSTSALEGDYEVFGTDYAAQTFIPTSDFNLSRIDIPLFRYTTLGTIIFDLHTVDPSTHKPSAKLQQLASLSASEIPYAAYTLMTIRFTPITLENGTEYAIVMRNLSAEASDTIIISANETEIAGTYAWESNDSGTTWTAMLDPDLVDPVYIRMTLYETSTIKNHLISGTCTKSNTDRLGTFSLRIVNDEGRFLNKFDGGETVDIYLGYDSVALYMKGKIDSVKYGLNLSDGFYVVVEGREYPELIDKTVTGIESAATADISLCGVLNEYFSDIQLAFWNGSSWSIATYDEEADTVTWNPSAPTFPSTLINMQYQHKKGWNFITEVCKIAGLDCYLEYDDTNDRWLLKTFIAEAIINTDEGISYGINLMSLSECGYDNDEIYNRAIVYGKVESDNILLMKTEDDTASQSNLWIKERIFNEASLSTMDDVQTKANYEISQGTNAVISGRASSLCLPTLKPGERIYVSVPYCNINGYFRIQSVSHNFKEPITTSVEITKKIKNIVELFIPKINADEFVGGLSNPNDMKDSYTVYFGESPSVMTHTNTQEVDGKLKLADGETTGYAIANIRSADYDVTECEFRRYENMSTENDVYQVSNNGGTTWETYTADTGETHTFAVPGNQLTFKMTLNRTAAGDTSPTYESVCLLFK